MRYLLMSILVLGLVAGGCQEKRVVSVKTSGSETSVTVDGERAGEKADEALKKAGEETEKALDKAGDAVKDATR